MKNQDKLRAEINALRHELSVTIPEEIQFAIELGGRQDNSELSDALSRQRLAEIRISQLLERLNAYKTIDLNDIPRDRISIGSMVKTRHLETKKIVYFKIVLLDIQDCSGYTEATINSPIGRALRDKKVDDVVSVVLPRGKATYRILNVETIHDINAGF